MRALAKAIGKAVGFAVFAAIVIALYMTGANVYGYFAGPWTPVDQSQAAMAKLADATLYSHSLREIRALLGEPEHVECSSGYRWYRGAIRERAASDIPIRVEIDDSGWPAEFSGHVSRSEDRRPGALARSDRGAA